MIRVRPRYGMRISGNDAGGAEQGALQAQGDDLFLPVNPVKKGKLVFKHRSTDVGNQGALLQRIPRHRVNLAAHQDRDSREIKP